MAAFLIFTRPMEVISTARAGNGRTPGERPFSNVQAHFHKAEHCEHFRRRLRRQLTNALRPASLPLPRRYCRALLTGLLQPVFRSKPGLGSIKRHTRDA